MKHRIKIENKIVRKLFLEFDVCERSYLNSEYPFLTYNIKGKLGQSVSITVNNLESFTVCGCCCIDDKEQYCCLIDDSLLFYINDSRSKHIYF